jgi:hypothetical protein
MNWTDENSSEQLIQKQEVAFSSQIFALYKLEEVTE